MEENKSNIKDFNTSINLLLAALRARNRKTPDIVTNLFEAYKDCANVKFVGYI
jgi:hypothetical protein